MVYFVPNTRTGPSASGGLFAIAVACGLAIGTEAGRASTPSQAARAADHWAFQPVEDRDIPDVTEPAWSENPIDAFVRARIERDALANSPPADRRTLIRRLAYTLTGLPPAAARVRRFIDDPRPDAYLRLIDEFLLSPQYGEQWARKWLDVARYSDTKGYVYAREERFWVHAWSYRDWVVRSLNEDMQYDRFLLLQLAADQLPDRRDDDLAAMGFLTVGRRFLGVRRDIIDDRIDVVCRGTMGLTVGCARCHDHKYDPIATADYYSLYGVFDSCSERLVRTEQDREGTEEFEKELKVRQEKLATRLAAHRRATADRVRGRVGDYLHAQTELHKYPAAGFDQVFQESDLLPAFVWHWEEFLRVARRRGDPIFVPWHAFAELPQQAFESSAADAIVRLRNAKDRIHPFVATALLDKPPRAFTDVIDAYASLFSRIDAQWKSAVAAAEHDGSPPPTRLPDPAAEALRRVLYGSDAACEVPDEPLVNIERFFTTSTVVELWKLQGEVDRWIINSAEAVPHSLILVDRQAASEPRIFRRGNPLDKGDDVPRQFLPVLSGAASRPFQTGSGRLELATEIVDPANPLTARVIVNRVWAHHFGRGLVATPSDFGTRAAPPSHPALLDWLTSRFIERGWSLKWLHRTILQSATFRQASTGPVDAAALARARKLDPQNRLLWRNNPRRLTFEEFRDSMVAAGGRLDRQLGGKPFKIFAEPYANRRTLYGLVDRQFLPEALRTFDFANPDLHIPQRNETTVPQQALFFMNHPLVLHCAETLADVVTTAATPEEAVRRMFQHTYQRDPTAAEVAESLNLVLAVDGTPSRSTASEPRDSRLLTGWEQLAQLMLCTNEFLFVD